MPFSMRPFSQTLGRLGNQIIIGVPDDLDPSKLAQRQWAAHIHPAVDVWSIRFPPGDLVTPPELILALVPAANQTMFPRGDSSAPQFRPGGLFLHQNPDGPADERRRYLPGDLVLRRHG